MGYEMKFKHQWAFKKRENEFNSPSNEFSSTSSSETAHKKHKLVSNLILLEKDGTINNCRVQQNGETGLCTESQLQLEKGKKEHTERVEKDTSTNNDLKKDSNRKFSRKNGTETSPDELVALNDVKLFMESLLEDLTVTRENLFTWMKEEMQTLAANDTDPWLKMKECSYRGKNVQVHHQDRKKIEEHNQNNFQENIRVHHGKHIEEKILVQHQNSFKKNLHMQHHNKFQATKVWQHQNDLEEDIQVQDQKDFKCGMGAQNGNAGSLEKSIQSNEESGFDNCYQTLEDLDDYVDASGQTISTEKVRVESMTLYVEPNAQSCPANHSSLVQHQKTFLPGKASENCNGGALKSSVEGKRLPDPNRQEALRYRDDYGQIESIVLSPKNNGEDLGLSNATYHHPNQATSSMYLMLPNASGQPCFENHRLDIASCNYIQPTVAASRIGKSLEGASHQGQFSGLQQEERNGSFARLSYGNVGSFTQRSTTTSIIGTGFPDSLHQGIDTGFRIPRNRFSFENQTREKNNISGLKMDGGAISFPGESYALSEHYVADKFSSHSNIKAENRLNSFPNLRPQREHLFPK